MERPVYDEREPRLPMSAEDVVALLARMDRIDVWLDGGWGVDALIGEQTREHDDLDLVTARSDVPLLIEALGQEGYEVAKGQLPTCVVLLDPIGRQVDVHPVAFNEAGDGIYRMEDGRDWAYPAAGFAGRGSIAGQSVPCLTPEVQVLCHAGYELAETDRHDLAVLRERFGVSTGS
ncbi:MAG: amino acid transporter [Gaiellaceae bacterium]